MRIRWSFAQMCCAVSLVSPSIATHRTCQFWVLSEPVDMNKWWGMLSSGVVLLHDNTWPNTAAATKRLLMRFQWEVFDHPPSSTRTWLPVIFICFFIWNSHRRTTFWHNELQTRVENWLKAHAAGFYDEGIGKLVPLYEKYLCWSVDYVEK